MTNPNMISQVGIPGTISPDAAHSAGCRSPITPAAGAIVRMWRMASSSPCSARI